MKPRTSSTISVITTTPSSYPPSTSPRLQKNKKIFNNIYDSQENNQTYLEKATFLVDSISNTLCKDIIAGKLEVQEQESQLNIKIRNKEDDQPDKSQRISPGKTIQPQEHRKLIIKFKNMGKKMRKERQSRWLQLSQRSAQLQQQQMRNKNQFRLKTLQDRKKQIQKRMQDKKQLMKQISKSILESNSRLHEVKQKKFLYIEKQKQFFNNFTLPRIKQQQKILSKKHDLSAPIDIQQLNNHQQNYEKLRIDKQVNRSITMKLIQSRDSEYNPPQFVPKSYRILQQEQQMKHIQEQVKRKQAQMFLIRKKQYARKLEQKREQQQVKQQLRSKSHNEIRHQKQKSKTKIMNRQQMVNAGNQYLKELLKSNRNIAKARKMHPIVLAEPQVKQKKYKSPQQKQERKKAYFEQINKIKNRKIQQILKSGKISSNQKQQKLQYQIEKLDAVMKKRMKQDKSFEDSNTTAGMMLNSIQAKLALLEASGKIQRR